MEVPVALGRVVLGLVALALALALAERLRVVGLRVGQQPVVRAAIRLRRVPPGKTTAAWRCRARVSRPASRPGPRACHLKFHAPID
jgi:hypothetical protein